MEGIVLLIFLPILVSILMLMIHNQKLVKIIITLSVFILMITSVVLAITYYYIPSTFYLVNSELINNMIMVLELILASYVIYVGLKHKRYIISIMALTQAFIMMMFEFGGSHSSINFDHHLFIDKLSIIMVLLVAIIGGSICIFSINYMEKYHHNHSDIEDRRNIFFAIVFLFLSAMFGIVLSNDLVWIYFFWEITTICSFVLIGYSKSQEATNNALRALVLNVFGGLAFAIGIYYLGTRIGVTELVYLNQLSGNNSTILIPALLLSLAALTKSAQLPFSKWLLGAMVAPSPTSALLHSSTMVKAGVYLLIRISPILKGNISSLMVIFIGSITFLIMSIIAISQSDAKKVLAYSTMANLGLIVCCAGIGTYESIWAAILLILFHGVSKSLLFLAVGATEHIIGSRDIEDMHGLIVKLPEMALIISIGIAGMFLAPFGMLISKWAALKAFIDSNNIMAILFLAYGSAATLFYWTKWLGKLTAVRRKTDRVQCSLKSGEWFTLILQCILMILLCLLYPFISKGYIIPIISEMFGVYNGNILSVGNQYILVIMLVSIIALPFIMRYFTSFNDEPVPVYMAGINDSDNIHFIGAMGERKKMYLSTWYMSSIIKENTALSYSIYSTILIICCFFAIAIGGLL